MDSVASTASMVDHSADCSGKATAITRINAAKPAALEAVDRNPATGVGAPWYTSGAQKWNGTAETLKPNPTSTSPITAAIRTAGMAPAWKAVPRLYNRMADAMAQNNKYLMPASTDFWSRRIKPASTYSGIDVVSIARKSMIRSA